MEKHQMSNQKEEKKPKAYVFGKVDDPSEGSDAWLHEDVDTNPLFDFHNMPKLMKELGEGNPVPRINDGSLVERVLQEVGEELDKAEVEALKRWKQHVKEKGIGEETEEEIMTILQEIALRLFERELQKGEDEAMQRWKEYLEKTEVKHHPRGQDQ
jgi:hypothetical protein